VASSAGVDVESRPVSEVVGTEFMNVDLRDEQPQEFVEAVRRAFLETGMVLVRGQHDLSFEEQTRFAGYVGKPSKRLPEGFIPGAAELPSLKQYISNTRPDGYAREGNLLKHCDYCFEERLMLGVGLYGEVVAKNGGDTIFVNQKVAADRLDPELRTRLEAVQVRHVYDMDAPEEGYKKFEIEGKPRVRSFVRPPLIQHPVTGETLLFVNELMTDRIEGLAAQDSAALLQTICDHLDKPDFRHDHKWQVGDVVLWDNIKLQHGRTYMPPGERRSMRRIMIDTPD